MVKQSNSTKLGDYHMEAVEKGNYEKAKEEADRVDEQIIETLQEGHSFRVEAGAGSGKTYSLIKVIEWIQANKQKEFINKKQNVICITYTNAAVDVIKERLEKDSFIIPSTIHSFAWNAIKQYQSVLISLLKEDNSFQNEEGDFFEIEEVNYTLGHRYKEQGIQYLHHNDVLTLFVKLLEKGKFRRFFSNKYPLILIDEYQDTYKPIVDQFINHYISTNTGPQFGFFGDAWQTIYQSNNACGLVDHVNIKLIKKGSNFRSAPRIVDLLNALRPELPQQSAIEDFDGEVIVINCEDYSGPRRTDRNFKGDLPAEELRSRLDNIREIFDKMTSSEESLKTLMISHRVLATQQGYERLLEIIGNGLRDKEDVFLLFYMNTVEPIFKALQTSNTELLFDTLGISRYPITKKSEKSQWKSLEQKLIIARKQKSIDVLRVVIETKLVPIPQNVEAYYKMYNNTPELLYSNEITLKEFLDIDYNQFLSAIDFLYPEADFSTEHGVKGEEYDNVIFVISRGWNQYQFDKYAPMITKDTPIPKGKESSYERNRNLFYVCCSRAKKRLIFFVTHEIDSTFSKCLDSLVGKDNIYTFQHYIEQNKL